MDDMPAPKPTPHENPAQDANQQPPFPQPAISPDVGSPQAHSQHPNAEAFINAAAKHFVPDIPAPKRQEMYSREERQPQGRDVGKMDKPEPREEEPIMGGTPLDELTTPMFEKQGFNMTAPSVRRQQTSDTLRMVQEEPDEHTASAARTGPAPPSANTRPKAPPRFDSVRMGASALVSALNAMPWEEDEESSSSDEDGEPQARDASVPQPRSRPNMARMSSSLHTIRPMATNSSQIQQQPGSSRLVFPYRQNTVARKARTPAVNELDYQLGRTPATTGSGPQGFQADQLDTIPDGSRRSSEVSNASELSLGLPLDPNVEQMMQDRIAREQSAAEREEEAEITRAVSEEQGVEAAAEVERVVSSHESDAPSDLNAHAALRESGTPEEEVEAGMQMNAAEKRRIRREQLAERMKDVFGLDEREEVLEEMRCWLLRSVMLKGYMYLTSKHICFFAHMPNKENLIVKTGPLHKKASRTKMYSKYWMVLKNDVLSWYESTADPYFPKGNVSLQYVSSCDAIDETRFRLRTPERSYTFKADTEDGRDEWMKAIHKVMFKTQHEGESVKIVIPLEVILEVEKSPTLEFAETIEIRCVDPEDQMSVDSYFFASFQNNERAMKDIQKRLDERPSSDLPHIDSMSSLPTEELVPMRSRTEVATSAASSATTSGLKKITSVFKPILPKSSTKTEEDRSSSIPAPPQPSFHSVTARDSSETLRDDLGPYGLSSDGYPPKQTSAPPSKHDDGKTWAPSWIRKPASKIFGTGHNESSSSVASNRLSLSPQSTKTTRTGRGKRPSVTEVVEPKIPGRESDSDGDNESDDESVPGNSPRHSRRSRHASPSASMRDQSTYSIMNRSESGLQEDDETAQKFRAVFSLTEKEELIDHFPGYLYRVLPVSGRFFVSTNYLCFRSSQLLYKTKMMIPLRDLYGLKAQKAFRFGHSGLIVVIKGHEEVFLEFSSAKRLKACVTLLEQMMERVRNEQANEGQSDHVDELSQSTIQMRIEEDLDESAPLDTTRNVPPLSPSPLFGSTTSTFLEFKPEPMKITCLTIGSRGDVQPYIALCKGLQAEGHTTRIATHGEYKDWVEGHGIEFASVGGDPAELMQMCVDNGMFTVSFLKEGIQKFRGWLDDLLSSSWEACQGSELLIESPSAMGGLHIAEALRIPYYRAFTMPWTRTRAYPHAFAVPEHKRGGAYNYMTYTMFDQVFWRAIAGQVNRWRKSIGIEATNFDKLEQHKIPFLYNFSPSVVPPPLDWTEWIHVTGYWFLENADESAKDDKWTPPEGLVEFIDGVHKNGKKVVYIGFGSIVVSDPEEMTRCVVDAVVESGVCAILSKGWSDRGSKKDDTGDADGADGVKYPDEIYSIDSIDHSWLFPRIDAACHHGGAGTSGASLRAGIPTIIKPFFGDQAFWSERVESLNVGSAIRKLTSEALAEALKKATTDEKQIAKAKIVGEMIRKENGVAKAIEAIYRDLEYARSIIKPLPETTGPLDKVTSLLQPLTHGRSKSRSSAASQDMDEIEHFRNQNQIQQQGRSGRMSGSGPGNGSGSGPSSDESWDVISEEAAQDENGRARR